MHGCCCQHHVFIKYFFHLLTFIPHSTFLRRKLCIKHVPYFKVLGISKFQTALSVDNKIYFKTQGNLKAIVKHLNYSIIQ